jgi:hypothetical protein
MEKDNKIKIGERIRGSEMKTDTKQKAKIEILGWITQFCLDNSTFGKEKPPFKAYEHNVEAGDLVALTSASFNKWYLSWVLEVEKRADGFDRYLLESIEDGALCWWSNVSFHLFQDREIPQKWRWTDRQFKLRDQWFRACHKTRDAYITLPVEPEFTDDGGVIFKTRTIFVWDENNKEIKFPDWKKVKVRDLLAFYDSVVEWRESLPSKNQENNDSAE